MDRHAPDLHVAAAVQLERGIVRIGGFQAKSTLMAHETLQREASIENSHHHSTRSGVEAAIHQHPAVLESAVFGVPDDTWGEAVKAVVVLKPGQSATAEEIIAETSKHLASYQKPKSVDFGF